MKFCEECFSNIEIQAIIKSFGTVGHCDINRNHTDVHTVDNAVLNVLNHCK
ncbi:hypothetical protein GWD55_04560 [Staphylococcus pseudintermedius]|nr:hypothetical protein [Staphylococcus pseudintermedius]